LTEAGGESDASDYESDLDGGLMPRSTDGFGEHAYRKDRIFKYLRILDKNVTIPDMKEADKHKLTVFMELDDVLLHTFICDENFGYIANPAAKEREHEFMLHEVG